MNKKFTRKEFLLNSGKAAVGVTAVAGLASIVTAANTKAAGVATWPWPYSTLDPDEVRVQAHYLYYNGRACCAGVFGSLVNAQAAVRQIHGQICLSKLCSSAAAAEQAGEPYVEH